MTVLSFVIHCRLTHSSPSPLLFPPFGFDCCFKWWTKLLLPTTLSSFVIVIPLSLLPSTVSSFVIVHPLLSVTFVIYPLSILPLPSIAVVVGSPLPSQPALQQSCLPLGSPIIVASGHPPLRSHSKSCRAICGSALRSSTSWAKRQHTIVIGAATVRVRANADANVSVVVDTVPPATPPPIATVEGVHRLGCVPNASPWIISS